MSYAGDQCLNSPLPRNNTPPQVQSGSTQQADTPTQPTQPVQEHDLFIDPDFTYIVDRTINSVLPTPLQKIPVEFFYSPVA